MADDVPSILAGYITEAEFAASADITTRTVCRYRNQPDGLPFLKLGGKVLIPVEDARAWLRARVVHPNARRT
ncbi:hypothetical protein [Bradyrhizobium sp. CCBAU 53415]|uniref:hypothetical protein n=1 Tax=Bradyrhizobium sp. CCBAU 53415 TaxID=1325119 RepID=UPI0023066ECD|nr:hypothetical protein [Bradyrhizobium sp. CCBAU 53415]MDA9465329.1 hypothetical protein [Bradyrhizobium sp. CCBAU 53415]